MQAPSDGHQNVKPECGVRPGPHRAAQCSLAALQAGRRVTGPLPQTVSSESLPSHLRAAAPPSLMTSQARSLAQCVASTLNQRGLLQSSRDRNACGIVITSSSSRWRLAMHNPVPSWPAAMAAATAGATISRQIAFRQHLCLRKCGRKEDVLR